MGGAARLAFSELRKKKLFVLLILIVSTISMLTILSAVTNAASTTYQRTSFTNSLNYNMKNVLSIQYQYTDETQEFTYILEDFLSYIETLEGVETVGKFDTTGIYFSELRNMEEYLRLNDGLVSKSKYIGKPEIVRILYADECLLDFVKGGVTNYPVLDNGHLPIYASEVFENILPVGYVLTDERTNIPYEIIGYIPTGAKWFSEDSLIQYPLISLDGWFIAPFSVVSTNDIITQLSCLQNTYIFVSDNAPISEIQKEIEQYSSQYGFKASASTLAAQYERYEEETNSFTTRQIFLAVFICIMATSSIVAVFTTNVLLKCKQYGVLLANGYTLVDIVQGITIEIFTITLFSAMLAWLIKLREFWNSTDLFRDILLEAHFKFALPLVVLLAVVLTLAASALPVIKIFPYRPSELIGGAK